RESMWERQCRRTPLRLHDRDLRACFFLRLRVPLVADQGEHAGERGRSKPSVQVEDVAVQVVARGERRLDTEKQAELARGANRKARANRPRFRCWHSYLPPIRRSTATL